MDVDDCRAWKRDAHPSTRGYWRSITMRLVSNGGPQETVLFVLGPLPFVALHVTLALLLRSGAATLEQFEKEKDARAQSGVDVSRA